MQCSNYNFELQSDKDVKAELIVQDVEQ